MRVVFDTNIFVSALTLPDGRAEEAVMRTVEGYDRFVLSKAILDELLDVLSRKFSREREELARAAVWLDEIGEWVRPIRSLNAAADEADNRILECALAGNADVIVTGDRDLLQMGNFEGTSVVSLREYLSLPKRKS